MIDLRALQQALRKKCEGTKQETHRQSLIRLSALFSGYFKKKDNISQFCLAQGSFLKCYALSNNGLVICCENI